MSALIFNACLLLLPIAGAAALLVIARDNLYAYEYSEAAAKPIRERVERLNSGLIQLDFDRQRQWDDLVAMELVNNDVAAARGFLLSARRMLPPREAGQLDRLANPGSNDAKKEEAALELLTPGTRARYEATVPLLSRRAASGTAQRVREQPIPLGDQRDFELLARSMLSDGDADPVQFVLTGFGLGLAGDFTPRMAAGASVLLDALRRPDYPAGFGDELSNLLGAAMPVTKFRDAALASASGNAAGNYANAAAAFRASLDEAHVAAAKEALDQIGAMSEATTPSGAAALLTHATELRDLPRLRLLAQAAGDRAVAAAKRLPRDGRLLAAARGELTMTRELTSALAVVALTLIGMLLATGFNLFQLMQRMWLRAQDDMDSSELVDTFSQREWRGL